MVHGCRCVVPGRRFCVLFSSYRLLYFTDDRRLRKKGVVDLAEVEAVHVLPQAGHGRAPGFTPVSYTHLTLPTICSV